MITKEDVKIVESIFKVLNKAKFSDIDGNEIVEFSRAFVALSKLQKKMEEMSSVKAPVIHQQIDPIIEQEVKPSKKKSK